MVFGWVVVVCSASGVALGVGGGGGGSPSCGFARPRVLVFAFGSRASDVYVTVGSQRMNSSIPSRRAAWIWLRTSAGPYVTPSVKSWSHGTTRAPVPRVCRRKSRSERSTISYGSLFGLATLYSPGPQCEG